MMITSPDRNHQTDCSIILPSTNLSGANDDNVKSGKKEETVSIASEEMTVSQPDVSGM